MSRTSNASSLITPDVHRYEPASILSTFLGVEKLVNAFSGEVARYGSTSQGVPHLNVPSPRALAWPASERMNSANFWVSDTRVGARRR